MSVENSVHGLPNSIYGHITMVAVYSDFCFQYMLLLISVEYMVDVEMHVVIAYTIGSH